MKNIHLLPTDKPSRLHFDSELFVSPKYQLSSSINSIVQGRHIYITSNEEIKEGYAYYPDLNEVLLFDNKHGEIYKKGRQLKVILTTDPELIADGVQAIDDEFLEWFVKNPSCEFVKTKLVYDYEEHPELVGNPKEEWSYYKIIIPQEEPKQDKWEQLRGAGLDQPLTSWDEIKQHVGLINDNIDEFDKAAQEYFERKSKFKQDLNDTMHEAHQTGRAMEQECTCGICDNCEEQETIQILKEAKENALKQKTLEEFIDKVDTPSDFDQFTFDEGIRVGAKWQAERMYSEEDLKSAFFNGGGMKDIEEFNYWLEQFKKD